MPTWARWIGRWLALGSMTLHPITFKDACDFISIHHRHHKPPQGWKFGTSIRVGDKVVGVVMVGRPVSRVLDNGAILEVIRLCTDGTPHAASMLYAAAWRATKALGYRKLITYVLDSEPGTSVKAAGWRRVRRTEGGSWDTPSRRRTDKAPIVPKVLWEITSEEAPASQGEAHHG
jgi:hypothetical protein